MIARRLPLLSLPGMSCRIRSRKSDTSPDQNHVVFNLPYIIHEFCQDFDLFFINSSTVKFALVVKPSPVVALWLLRI